MTSLQYVIAIIFGIALAGGQLLFKLAAAQLDETGRPLSLFKLLFTWPMLAALTLYACTVLLYVYLLQQVPLSKAYLFSFLGSVMVPVLAIVIFKEPFSIKYIVGAILIFVGLIISTTA